MTFRSLQYAFCIGLVWAWGTAPALASEPHLDRYEQLQLDAGARTLRVPARIAYRDALIAEGEGDPQRARQFLERAIRLDPEYADPYFTLARLELRQFDVDGAVHLAQGVSAVARSFPAHSLLIFNIVAMTPYVWFLMCLTICFAYAARYLPFLAHRLRELLRHRFRAAAPGFTAYLILLTPLFIIPGVITTLAYVIMCCWMFMRRRERLSLVLLVLPIVLFGWFGRVLKPLTPIADPASLTSLLARVSADAGSAELVNRLQGTSTESLAAERHFALGLAQQKMARYDRAAEHYFRSISLASDDPASYINLGNVHFMEERYDKALEGYRKAESIRPGDPVSQYATAQAYIKTLLMKEASRALQQATAGGIEDIKSTYTPAALNHYPVLPATFSSARMWAIAAEEGLNSQPNAMDEVVLPFTRFSMRVSAWVLVLAVAAAMILNRVLDPGRLTFPCNNCGRLTCRGCCVTERDMELCSVCAGAIVGVTSDKVIDALLRQKRQSEVVSRRKSMRLTSMLLPGLRDITWGRIFRGYVLAALFALSCVELATRGYLVKDTSSLVLEPSSWKLFVPMAGVVMSYLASVLGKPRYDVNTHRSLKGRHRVREIRRESGGDARVA